MELLFTIERITNMKNEIEDIRKDIDLYFDVDNKIGKEMIEYSESGNYFIKVNNYIQSDKKRNWTVSKIKIYKSGNSNYEFEFISDSEDTIYTHTWVEKDGIEYLFYPEAKGAQSVYDTKSKNFFSFYNNNEDFIWVSIYPSPKGDKIAVEGCYWACPYELRIYDISNIQKLPYPVIYHDADFGEGCVVEFWKDNDNLVVCKNEKEISTIKL